jgi:hypothetical protein
MNNPLVDDDEEPVSLSTGIALQQPKVEVQAGNSSTPGCEDSMEQHDGYMLHIERCVSPCSPTGSDDLDDLSMSYVFEYLRYYQEDMFWSLLSDVCFLAGSILYLLLSYCQMQPTSKLLTVAWYHGLEIMAPTLYLINSVVDIYWALLVQQRQKIRTEMTGLWRENTGLRPPLIPSFSGHHDDGGSPTNRLPTTSANDDDDPVPPPVVPWWKRLYKYAAHRRTLSAAGTFGLAALLSVIAVLWQYEAEPNENETSMEETDNTTNQTANILYTASDHVYVISAVIAMTGRRIRPWFYSGTTGNRCGIFVEPEALEDMGDFLFLIGSLFDATLDNLAMKTNPSLGAVSSVLWFVDALLYLQSDFVMSRRLRNSEFSSHIV